MKADIHQKITDQIVSELEKGVRQALECGACRRPHHAALRGNGIPYRGINVLMLWSAAIEQDYAAPVWMTFKQASELKAVCRQNHSHRD